MDEREGNQINGGGRSPGQDFRPQATGFDSRRLHTEDSIMSYYRIESRDGTDFGVFEADTAEEAFGAMVEDAGAIGAVDDDGKPMAGTIDDWHVTEIAAADLVLCTSADGWSLHAPGSTDEEIAVGDAPYIMAGEGEPTEADREAALCAWALGIFPGDTVEAGEGEDHDTGRVERIEGHMAVVAWDSGVKTPCPVRDLQRVLET